MHNHGTREFATYLSQVYSLVLVAHTEVSCIFCVGSSIIVGLAFNTVGVLVRDTMTVSL